MVGRVNVDYFFKEVCDSDIDFMRQTIKTFEEYSLSILSSLREHAENIDSDNSEALRFIHMSCGSIGLLGFTELANQLSQIENTLRDGQLNYDGTHHSNVSKIINQVNTELEHCLSVVRLSKEKR